MQEQVHLHKGGYPCYESYETHQQTQLDAAARQSMLAVVDVMGKLLGELAFAGAALGHGGIFGHKKASLRSVLYHIHGRQKYLC